MPDIELILQDVVPAVAQLKLGQTMKIRFPVSKQMIEGQVSFISPVTDAESGMVRVKVRIANADGKSRSGERCLIELKDKK